MVYFCSSVALVPTRTVVTSWFPGITCCEWAVCLMTYWRGVDNKAIDIEVHVSVEIVFNATQKRGLCGSKL
jgi:hypothetical protein